MEYLDALKSHQLKTPEELIRMYRGEILEEVVEVTVEVTITDTIVHDGVLVVTAESLACPACEAGGCMMGLRDLEKDP